MAGGIGGLDVGFVPGVAPVRSKGGPLKVVASEAITAPGALNRTPPAGAVALYVRGFGSGGSGCITNNATNLSGGGAGDWCDAYVTVRPSDTVTGIVAAGAIGPSGTASTTGVNGAATTLAVNGVQILSAAGGIRGSAGAGGGNTPAIPPGTSLGTHLIPNAGLGPGQAEVPNGTRNGSASNGGGAGAGGAAGDNVNAGNGATPAGGGGSVYNLAASRKAGNGGDGGLYLYWLGA